MPLTKAGATWVVGDRFYDRRADLVALSERCQEGSSGLAQGLRVQAPGISLYFGDSVWLRALRLGALFVPLAIRRQPTPTPDRPGAYCRGAVGRGYGLAPLLAEPESRAGTGTVRDRIPEP